jgi:hypothetical protein
LTLRGKSKTGLLRKPEKTFREAAELFEKEYAVLTEGQRSALSEYIKVVMTIAPRAATQQLNYCQCGGATVFAKHNVNRTLFNS